MCVCARAYVRACVFVCVLPVEYPRFTCHIYHVILFQLKMGFTALLSLHVFVAVATWQFVGGVTNLLVNPSFEEDLSGNWDSNGFTMERYKGDAKDGDYSLKCSGRYSGPCSLHALTHSSICLVFHRLLQALT